MSLQRLLFALLLIAPLSFAADEPKAPSEADVKAAIDRGNTIRKRTAIVPGVIGRNAFVIKVGGVRCGHGMTTIEDALGEKGAVYKLTEISRSALASDEGGAIMDFKGSYLLDSGLGLREATLTWTEKLNTKNNKQQSEHYTCTMKVADKLLTWSNDWSGKKTEDSLPLHGQTPIPQSILTYFAALADAAGIEAKPVCILELWPVNQQEPVDVQPVWLNLIKDRLDNKPATRVSVTHLVGEVTDSGLSVDLKNSVWKNPQTWILDHQFRTIGQPAPNPPLSVDTIDPDKLEPETPLDLEKIAAAMKADPKK
jgi:hypothetical protein